MLLLIIMLLVSDGRPIFFIQKRVGLNKKPFKIYKFRTLKSEGNRRQDMPVARDTKGRETSLGNFLRRSHIDEIPQLVNILRGDMSFVGPRPLPLDDVNDENWLKNQPEEKKETYRAWLNNRTKVMPGLTGKWQISKKPDSDIDNWVECDNWYLENISLKTDFKILLSTPFSMFK